MVRRDFLLLLICGAVLTSSPGCRLPAMTGQLAMTPPRGQFPGTPSAPPVDLRPLPDSTLPGGTLLRQQHGLRQQNGPIQLGKPESFPPETTSKPQLSRSEPKPSTTVPESAFVFPEVPPARTTRPAVPLFTIPPENSPTKGPLLTEALKPVGVNPLSLTVIAPTQRSPGSPIRFKVVIRNDGSEAVSDAVLVGEFDDSLIFPGSPEKAVRQTLRRLEPGETRESTLTLQSETNGPQMARFRVTAAGQSTDWQAATVTIGDQQLELSIHGPEERTVGHRAEFNIHLLNQTAQELRGVEVVVTFDGALQVKALTAGAKITGNRLRWPLGSLAAREGLQLQVEFESRDPTSQACLRVAVNGEQLATEEREKCLRIVPRRGALDLQLTDLDDPVRNGTIAKFELRIKNVGLESVTRVGTVLHLPAGLKLISATPTLNGLEIPLETEIDGHDVILAPLNELPPESVLLVAIQVEATQPGPCAVKATITSDDADDPVTLTEWLSVIR